MNTKSPVDGSEVAGIMQPTNSLKILSVNDLYYHVLAQVEQYGLNTNMFESDLATTEIITPANFALYLFGLAYSHINRVGQLGGSNKNDVCMNPEEFAIPLGFAKYLEHLGPYESEGCVMRTAADLSSVLQTTSALFGLNVPAHFWGFGLMAFSTALNQWGLVQPSTASGDPIRESSINPNGQAVTLAELWSSIAGSISQEIVQSGLACVLYKDIPPKAPNASAYALCYAPGGTAAVRPVDTGAMWICISPDFSNEEALLFGSFSFDPTPLYLSNFQKCVCLPGPTLSYDPAVPAATFDNNGSPHFFNAWLGSRQDKYRPGPILDSYTLCKEKVRSLGFSIQIIDPNSIYRTAYNVLNQFLRTTTLPSTDQQKLQLIYLYFQITVMCIVSRVNQSTPVHYLSTSNQNVDVPPTAWSQQTGYVSRAWLSTQLPPALVRFIDSIGPVLINGMMVVPVIPAPSSAVTPNYSDGTQHPNLSIGQAGEIDSGEFGAVYFGNPALNVTGTVPALGFAPEGTPITDALLLSSYYTAGSGLTQMLFWNTQMPYFTGLLDRLHKSLFSGSGISSSLIHLHNPTCGDVSAMLTGVTLSQAADTVNVPDLDFNAGFVATFQDAQPVLVASYVNLSEAEVVEALMYRFFTTSGDNTTVKTARFAFRPPSASSGSQLLQSFNSKTFSPESSFSKALSARESTYNPVVKSVSGVDIIRTSDEGCWVRDLIKTAAREGFKALRLSAPMGVGLLCNTLLPGSGAVCSVGAEKILSSISSFRGVEAESHEPPTRSQVFFERNKLTPRQKKTNRRNRRGRSKKVALRSRSVSKSRSRSRSQSKGRPKKVTLKSRSRSRSQSRGRR